MKRVVVIGAGGHGREVAEILRQREQHGDDFSLLGFIDDQLELRGQVRDSLPVLGGFSWFDGVDRGEVAVICAAGSPAVCKHLSEKAKLLGLTFINAISPRAYVSPYAQLGEGIVMFPESVASTQTFLADYCTVNLGATLSHDVQLGRYTNINPGVHLAGNVVIGEGCYIGMGTNVIQEISIGDWTTIGAGSVVIRDLPAKVTAAGVPARIIKAKENITE